MSEKIVAKLLEDKIDPKAYAMSMGNIDLSDIDPATLATFKRQAKGYIKWVMADAYDHNVAEDIDNAVEFDQVARILSPYDEPDLSFLDMIAQDYF